MKQAATRAEEKFEFGLWIAVAVFGLARDAWQARKMPSRL